MREKEIRWRQRFQNFTKAFRQLEEAVMSFERLNVLEKEGLIQRFEYTFELAWKTLKDYLEAQEVTAAFPREVIKTAFHYGLISDGEVWMEMLEKRNIIAHTYDEERFRTVVTQIKESYFPAIAQIYRDLEGKV